MPTLILNDIQAWKLFQFMQTQGKGGPHLRRMQRLRTAFQIDQIEEAFEKNQETIDEFRSDGRAVPKSKLTVFKVDDPAREIEIETADLDKVHTRVVAAWDKEVDPDPGKEIDPVCKSCGRSTETMDDRVYLPILDTVKAAWAEVKEAGEAKPISKSVAQPDPGGNGQPEDARPLA